jgi:putative membrane-bound dehydrogenase-like protein
MAHRRFPLLLTMTFVWQTAALLIVVMPTVTMAAAVEDSGLHAGAATVNITPPLGEPIVGGFHPYPATHVHDELHARCLVLDDGSTKLAIVVCDLLGIHRSVSDEARRLIKAETGIPGENVLISATHTHSATTALGGAGNERFDPELDQLSPYQAFVVRRIADGVRRATNLLRPAELAAGTIDIPEHVFNRRWFMRPGSMPENPFGLNDDLVKMNPPAGSPNLDRPAGPVDPTVSVLAIREPDGRPLSIFAAYSLHYVGGVGSGHVSADYFGIVCDELARLADGERTDPPFVALLANGTSGDINNINFRTPRHSQKPYEQMRAVAVDVAAKIHAAVAGLTFSRQVPLAARYRELPVRSRQPTEKERAWADATLEKPATPDAKKTLAEIYAGRVKALAKQPETLAVPLQVLAIGPALIGTMPCEVFCEIGLEFRRRSGGSPGFLVSIAHGYLGYLPTPRQHELGGYETWPGTNRLEKKASENMLAALLEMCGDVSKTAAAPSPAKSLSRLQVAPGLRVELVAAEPEVIDPVALAFDERGRLWVAEMRDYPTGPLNGEPPRSRIKVLEDRDADGRYECATLFADELTFCNGLQPWRGGVIATCGGRVAWLADTDGDGRADHDETLFTGFAEQNSQLRANHPTLGIDGMVYVANGLRGGQVSAADTRWRQPGADASRPLDIRGRDFRFDPRGVHGEFPAGVFGTYETVTGHGQFGLTFDDFGTRFVCSNRNPCIQVVLEEHDLARNPGFGLSASVHDVAPAGAESRLQPLSAAWTTSNLHAGQFTAACGVTIHRGDGLSEDMRGDAFTCDPTGNLVHRSRLRRDGVVYTTMADSQSEGGREFLASPEDWFRPVALTDGPDGCLYVADMCRAVIEHPDFMPDELKQRPDLRWGDTQGRIWRIVPKSGMRRTEAVHLADLSAGDLVAQLDHANGWHRDTAARLLLERSDPATHAPLRRQAQHGQHPAGRAQALHLLARLGGLDSSTLLAAADPASEADQAVRVTAIRLAGPRLSENTDLRRLVMAAAEDRSPLVRFEAALRLGDVAGHGHEDTERAIVRALAAVASRDFADHWTRAAIGTAVRGRAAALLIAMLSDPVVPDMAAMLGDLGEIAATGNEPLAEPLRAVASAMDAGHLPADVAIAIIDGIGRGLGRRRTSLASLAEDLPPDVDRGLAEIFAHGATIAVDSSQVPHRRVRAIRALRHAGLAMAGPALIPLAASATDQDVRIASITTLALWSDPAIDAALLDDIAAQTPAVRRAVLDASCGQPSRAARLIDAIDRGACSATLLTPDHWKRLADCGDGRFRERAGAIRAAHEPADRRATITDYQAALALPGDVGHGREVFVKHCAGCHRIGSLGVNVGPDISDSRTQKPEQYLVHILDPNRVVDSAFFAYTVVLTDGRVFTGLIAAEAGSSITLRLQDGKEMTIVRDEIETITSAGTSLMPVGLERSISVPDMADLIAFIKGWRYGENGLPPTESTARTSP